LWADLASLASFGAALAELLEAVEGVALALPGFVAG
jgi:hypothetical protein